METAGLCVEPEEIEEQPEEIKNRQFPEANVEEYDWLLFPSISFS